MSAASDLLELPAQTGAIVKPVLLRAIVAFPTAIIAFGVPVFLFETLLTFALILGPRGVFLATALCLLFVAGVATFMGGLVGMGVAVVDAPKRPLVESLKVVFRALPWLAAFYAPLPLALALSLTMAELRPGETTSQLVVALVSVAAFLLATRRLGFAPVALVRGAELRKALALSAVCARGHGALAVVAGLVPALLAVGGVVSTAFVHAERRWRPMPSRLDEPREVAAWASLWACLLFAPYLLGVLKVAALRVAGRARKPNEA